MDHSLFFNHLSTPAPNAEKAYYLLFEAFQGVLSLNQSDDRFQLYFDEDDSDNCRLAENFAYGDFKGRLSDEQEIDLLSFIYEIEDKSPFIEHIKDDDFDELSKLSAYIEGEAYERNTDILALAWLRNGIALSLATKKLWRKHIFDLQIRRTGEHNPVKCSVHNVSEESHARFILEDFEENLEDVCAEAFFSEEFMDWYDFLKKEDKSKIKEKLRHCRDNDFRLVRPVIDTLNGSRFPNMKEIRVGTPHGQRGQIRILFAMGANRKANILIGFIKHGSDYAEHIETADALFETVRDLQ